MEFAEIPRPFLDDDEGVSRRNPLFYSGTKEPNIPTFTGFGDNITGDFLRPGRQSDGVLNLPRYHPKYSMSGHRNGDEMEFLGSLDEPQMNKIHQNGTLIPPQEDHAGSLYLIDPPDEMINFQQADAVRLQEKVLVERRYEGSGPTCYTCCYSPSTLICGTVPSFCCPCTPWIKRVSCIGLLIVLNVFLVLLVLAIGLELGTDGFTKKGNNNKNESWAMNTNNLVNNILCQSNSTNCWANNCATGSKWSPYYQHHLILVLSIAGLIGVFFGGKTT